jgi:hypothetical protein
MFLIINALNRLHLKSLGSFFSIFFSNAQGELKAVEGYTPKIGEIVYMLQDLKDRITAQVKDLDQSQVNYLYDANANSIGALIMHLVSTESYYLIATLKVRNWSEEKIAR